MVVGRKEEWETGEGKGKGERGEKGKEKKEEQEKKRINNGNTKRLI